jgi:hypothetical protein
MLPLCLVGGQRAGLLFADVLTQVFEEVAAMVEQHHHTVETLYGADWTHTLIHQLQVCAKQLETVSK